MQYEAQYDPYVDKGGRRYAKLTWVQTTPAPLEQFAVKLPLTSDDPNIGPKPIGVPSVNGAGEKLYLLPDQKLKVGETLTITVDYVPRLPQTAEPKGVAGLRASRGGRAFSPSPSSRSSPSSPAHEGRGPPATTRTRTTTRTCDARTLRMPDIPGRATIRLSGPCWAHVGAARPVSHEHDPGYGGDGRMSLHG